MTNHNIRQYRVIVMWLCDWLMKRRRVEVKIFPWALDQCVMGNGHNSLVLCDNVDRRCGEDVFRMFKHCMNVPIKCVKSVLEIDFQTWVKTVSINGICFWYVYGDVYDEITLESFTDAGDELMAEIADRLKGWQIRGKTINDGELRPEPVLTVRHNDLTPEQYCELAESVGAAAPAREQAAQALEHTLFRVSVWDGDRIVAMARMNGDLGLYCHINDVAVRPEYQRRGIGRMLVNELLLYIDRHAVAGTDVAVDISAAAAGIPFYWAMGFTAMDGPNLRLVHHSGRPLGDGPSIVKV